MRSAIRASSITAAAELERRPKKSSAKSSALNARPCSCTTSQSSVRSSSPRSVAFSSSRAARRMAGSASPAPEAALWRIITNSRVMVRSRPAGSRTSSLSPCSRITRPGWSPPWSKYSISEPVYFIPEFTRDPIVTATASEDHMQSASLGFADRGRAQATVDGDDAVTIPSLVANSFLEDLTLVMCVAAATTVIFDTLRQPVVVGYLVAGIVVGPYTPGLLVDTSRLHGVSELGVILLMFALGLEFSIRRLLRLGPRAAFITAVQVGLMIWLGYICGRALGWSELESVFTGALLSISSTTIVAKAFAEHEVGADLRDLALGVLLCEDLVAVIMLAVLTPLADGAGPSP